MLRCRSKMFSNFKNIQFWRPAVTDPHKVRPCNCTGRSPNHIGIDPEWFSPLYISRVGIWPFDGPLQNRTFWPVNYQISTKLSPNLTDYYGSAVHAHAFIYTGGIGDGREGTHRKYKVHILIVACLQCSDAGQKCFQILRIFNFGVQLWLTRTRSDLVTAQVDRPIILESTLNDSALYLQAVFRSSRLMDPIQNTTFWPVNYQNSTELSPTLTDYCGSAVHIHAFIFTGWIDEGT